MGINIEKEVIKEEITKMAMVLSEEKGITFEEAYDIRKNEFVEEYSEMITEKLFSDDRKKNNDDIFNDSYSQNVYNKSVNEDKQLFNKTQLNKRFSLKPKEDSIPVMINMSYIFFNDGVEEINGQYAFYTKDQCVDIIKLTRREHKASNDINADNSLEGINICFTGIMDRPRLEMLDIAKVRGAIVNKSVVKLTDILVAGKKVGANKIDKATKLGVKIISENDFWSMVE
ncbi:BRCT domain-containing protein [Clostridium gasigenes]|uniref:BRCT domain-containing protein n=1 Tax=Clostridium gasigenes TaxID=94869 RepID=UPI001C0DC987|nr:BRCT domain-containing protein [Clostridium gasigenes]MBU3102918.1 BRCT domain-containing protein [Clostridium gasigenes]